MSRERHDLLTLLAEGDRLAYPADDQWAFEGTDQRFAGDLVRRLIPTYINYAGATTGPHDYSIVFWITEEGKRAVEAASKSAA